MKKNLYRNKPRNQRMLVENRFPVEYRGNKSANLRSTVDERVIFERLWRGALCQALGPKAPLIARRPRQCCCHCDCINQRHLIGQRIEPQREALRSVIR